MRPSDNEAQPVPPLRAEFSTHIRRPVETVWAYVSDLRRTPEWRTTVRSVTPPDAPSVGATCTATTKVLGRRWHWTLEITEWDPPHRLAFRTIRGAAHMATTYVLEPDGDGCRFTFVGSSSGTDSWLLRLLTPLFVRELTRQARRHVDILRRTLEGDRGDPRLRE